MKNSDFKRMFRIVVACLILASCAKENSSDVNQDKIYTDYELFYDHNTDKTMVLARFRFGGPTGTILELDSGANVKFNNETLPYNALLTGHYKEYAGRIVNGTFVYTNQSNHVFTNSVPLYDSIAFAGGFDTIVKGSANTLTWAGTPLAANQLVGVFVGRWTWGQDALYLQDGDGSTNLVMGTGQLSGVPVGPAVCYMDRYTEVDVAEGTSKGGRIRGKYRALNRTVQVVP